MAAAGFEATVRHDDGVPVIDLHGEVNGLADGELTEAYTAAAGHEPDRIVLNFGDVAYINSTGIALIVGLLAKARQAHVEISAFGLTDHYRQIFEITRLADFVRIFPDELSAVQATNMTKEAGA